MATAMVETGSRDRTLAKLAGAGVKSTALQNHTSPRPVQVSSIAIHPGKHLGASAATAANATKTDLEQNLGADVLSDYQKQASETALHDYDVVIDTSGGENHDTPLCVLKPGGTVISITGPPDPAFACSPPDTSAPLAPGCASWPPWPAPRALTRSPKPPGVARIPTLTAAQK